MFIETWDNTLNQWSKIIRQIIGHGSQNQNQESNDANGIDFARNNNVNEDSVNTTEECTNVQLTRMQKQLLDVNTQQRSNYLNYQKKSSWVEN